MFKEHLKYTNYNDEVVEEDLYFNLSKAELLEMNFQAKGGLENYLQSIINTHDVAKLADIFKELLLKSYGVKDPSGRTFMKNDKIREEFVCSIPYEELYTRYSTDAKAAANFVNGIVPKELREAVAKAEANKDSNIVQLDK